MKIFNVPQRGRIILIHSRGFGIDVDEYYGPYGNRNIVCHESVLCFAGGPAIFDVNRLDAIHTTPEINAFFNPYRPMTEAEIKSLRKEYNESGLAGCPLPDEIIDELKTIEI